ADSRLLRADGPRRLPDRCTPGAPARCGDLSGSAADRGRPLPGRTGADIAGAAARAHSGDHNRAWSLTVRSPDAPARVSVCPLAGASGQRNRPGKFDKFSTPPLAALA